jgi:hypothetical protein
MVLAHRAGGSTTIHRRRPHNLLSAAFRRSPPDDRRFLTGPSTVRLELRFGTHRLELLPVPGLTATVPAEASHRGLLT